MGLGAAFEFFCIFFVKFKTLGTAKQFKLVDLRIKNHVMKCIKRKRGEIKAKLELSVLFNVVDKGNIAKNHGWALWVGILA